MENDPKHTSRRAQVISDEEGVNRWKTPAESPDCNLIENLWHELKEFIRREIKPSCKNELIQGIKEDRVDVDNAFYIYVRSYQR